MSNSIMSMFNDLPVGKVFHFQPYQFVKHPSTGRSAIWLRSALMYGSPDGGKPTRIELSSLPSNTWVDLVDEAGNSVPLSVCRESEETLLGRWLPRTIQKLHSRCLSVVIVQKSTKSFPLLHNSSRDDFNRREQAIIEPLMVPLQMIMSHELSDRGP